MKMSKKISYKDVVVFGSQNKQMKSDNNLMKVYYYEHVFYVDIQTVFDLYTYPEMLTEINKVLSIQHQNQLPYDWSQYIITCIPE